jgi:hypothetical protein
MHSKLSTPLVLTLAVLCMLAPVVLAADQASGQLPHARIATVEGATTTYHVEGMHGQMVTVDVPSQSIADVRLSNKAQGTVGATVMSVDSETNRVKVRTQEGQKLVLEMPPTFLKQMRIGGQVMLMAPWQPA